jgi:hypothetical protein
MRKKIYAVSSRDYKNDGSNSVHYSTKIERPSRVVYRVCGNLPTPYSKIYLDNFFAITFDRNNHTPGSCCHFEATNESFNDSFLRPSMTYNITK